MGLAKDSSCSEFPPDAAHLVDDLRLIDIAACHATIRLIVGVWNALMILVVLTAAIGERGAPVCVPFGSEGRLSFVWFRWSAVSL